MIGGLYGNLPVIEAIEILADREQNLVTLCFNGDFKRINVDDDNFVTDNYSVSNHHGMLGNTEVELIAPR